MNEFSGSSEAYYPPDSIKSSSNSLPPPSQADWNYEVTVQKVEAIVARIEAGELELAEVFDQFAAAVEHLRQCETFLTQRQQQMDVLIETLTDEPEI